MTTQNLKRVAYVALHTRDADGMANFYQERVGLSEVERDAEGNVYLQCDRFHHALVLMPTGELGMHHYGLDTGSEAALQAAATKLEEYGAEVREVTSLKGQGAALEVTDPAGNVLRLLGGTETGPAPDGVRAVRPTKFGHLNNLSPVPLGEVRDFYVDGLDFRVSDWLLDRVLWVRCNPDHHGVAYGAAGRKGLQHLCFEAPSIASLVHQADHLARDSQPLLWGPGRHGPGNNAFIYFHDPEANIIELTAEVEQIWDDENREDPWDPGTTPNWGNHWGTPPPAEFVANMAPDYVQRPLSL